AGIGIQTSLYAVFRESEYTIAIMKAVGATSRFISLHFTFIVLMLGAAGTILGLALSSLLQIYFPILFAEILPAKVNLTISWLTVFEGLILGTVIVALFSFLPLQRIKNLRPAYIFRKEIDKGSKGLTHYATIAVIVLFFVGLAIWQLEDIKIGIYFILGVSTLIGIATLITQGLLYIMQKSLSGSLALRQAFRGLFRPNNATRAIIVTLSVSLAVIFSIYLINQNLRTTFIESYPDDLPNAYFLDIQPEQKDEFVDIIGIGPEFFPIVRARLSSINNNPINRKKEKEKKRDNLSREFNLTHRDILLNDEQLIEGKTLFGKDTQEILNRGEIPVSVLDMVAENGNIKMGDLLVFKIQGIPLSARVTSMRTRTESKVRPFFYFVFPEGSFKDAPQTLFSAVKLEQSKLTTIQNTLTTKLPNVSVIDIGATVKILGRIMQKMSSIVQFFTSFSIVAGVLIIISSIFATRLTRISEAVYFKILGAKSSFVVKVFTYENLIIAFLSSSLATIISQTGSWLICNKVLDIAYKPFIGSTIIMITATLILVIGV
ncbi:MAG: FtsX-like permease family protein, partial [Desulfocapsa sp.]|nr:FtsX-like permease family protein [Desulfocapsa sp.]